MAKKDNLKKLSYDDFKGVDLREEHTGDKNICELVNFRITEEGSLKKRCGFGQLCSVASDALICAVWGGILDGSYVCFYLSGTSLYKLNLSTKESTHVGDIEPFWETPKFFFFKDSLYLYASSKFYRITPNSITEAFGYVPLYGKDWETTFPGEIHEPLNILNGIARISYVVPESYSTTLATGIPIGSVLSVHKNGELLSSDEYHLDHITDGVVVPGISTGDRLLVTYKFDLDKQKDELLECTYVDVFSGINNCRVFMWGAIQKNLMYASSFVSNDSLSEAKALFPQCDALYFPLGNEFLVGDGKYAITGISRHYDRLLIFTEGDAWMADSSDCAKEYIPVMSINSSVGCSVNMNIAKAKNDPVTVWNNAVYRWTSDTDELNECNAFCISKEINSTIESDFFTNIRVFKNARKNEIWFHNPYQGDCVWIYNVDQKAWIKFTGILAMGFFDADGEVGFYTLDGLYQFSESFYYDMPDGEFAYIDASLKIKNINFGTTDKKRLSKLVMHGESESGEIKIKIHLDTGEYISVGFTQDQEYSQITKRLHSGRFSYISELLLEAPGDNNARHVIHDIDIYAG